MNQGHDGDLDGASLSFVSPRMVGRDRELATAEQALFAALRGECRVVVLSGDAGVGKSRLAVEIQRRARDLRCSVLAGECSEVDVSLPYLPFVEAIGNHLGSGEADVPALRSLLGTGAAALARLIPGLGDGDSADIDVESPLQKLRLFEAVVTLLRSLAAAHGLLLVVEDLHWADHSTRELLDFLTRRLRGSRTLILVTARTVDVDRRHPLLPTLQRWRRAGVAQTIELSPLSEAALAEMLAAIFDVSAPPMELVHGLHRRSDGVPFAVEEILQDAVERGAVQWTSGAELSGLALSALPAPRSLAEGVLARVERLDGVQVDVLRQACVLGQSFDFDLLARVCDSASSAVMDAVEACVAAQLLVPDAKQDNAFRFRHAVVREALYEAMIVSRRRLRHSRVADVLLDDASADPTVIARHLLAAARIQEAAPACAAAAELAMRQLAPREACDLFQRALDGTTERVERGRIRCRLGEALHLGGDVTAAQRELELGVEQLQAAGDEVCAARHEISLGRCCWEHGQVQTARAHYEHARDVLEREPASAELADALLRLAGLSAAAFDAVATEQLARRALDVAAAASATEMQITARDWLGVALCDQGRLHDGVEQLLQSADTAEQRSLHLLTARILAHATSVQESYGRVIDSNAVVARMRGLPSDPWLEVVIPYYEGWRHLWFADLRAAHGFAQTCIERAQRYGMEAQAAWGRTLLAAVLTEMDDAETAAGLLPAADASAELQVLLELAWVRIRNRIAAGDPGAALTAAREVCAHAPQLAGTALADATVEALIAGDDAARAANLLQALQREPRSQMHVGHLLRAQARVLLAQDEAAAAGSLLQRAAEVFRESGYELEARRTLLLLADTCVRRGDAAAAGAALQSVIAAQVDGETPLLRRQALHLAETHGVAVTDLAALSESSPAPAAPPADERLAPGERFVTVLFADVRGYTAISQERGPQDMAGRIAALQRTALHSVQRHHGFVDKFAGDAVMATFNASGAHVEHTRHAVEVGLDLVASTSLLQIGVGVGVAAGPAIVGRLTPDANVSVLGEVTNLASRLQGAAGPGELLLSRDAYRRVQHDIPESVVRVEECRLDLKGYAEPVAAMRLVTRWTPPSAASDG